MKVVGLAVIVMACAGCSKPAPSASALDERQAALNAIADKCGVPRSAWRLLDADHVTLQGAAYTDPKSSCLIDELFKSKLPVKLGFIAEPPPEQVN